MWNNQGIPYHYTREVRQGRSVGKRIQDENILSFVKFSTQDQEGGMSPY
jgi:hypothetical protein